MAKRIAAILLIYLCAAGTWIGLGEVMDRRTDEYDQKLRGAVGQLWGTKLRQVSPTVSRNATWSSADYVPLQGSDMTVDLRLKHLQKGLLWYSTYSVTFGGRYQISNDAESNRTVAFEFKLPTENGMCDDVKLLVRGKEITDIPVMPMWFGYSWSTELPSIPSTLSWRVPSWLPSDRGACPAPRLCRPPEPIRTLRTGRSARRSRTPHRKTTPG